MLEQLQKRLESKHLSIQVTQAAKDAVISRGYDQNFGARPLKRFIQRNIETLVARMIIAQDIEPDSLIKVDFDGSDFTAAVSEG
jgi:ATP-dependent Clp protease ATP-binding subunit ClpB